MAIKISGTTVIDDSRNLVSVGVATVGSGDSAVILNGDTGITNIGSGVTINGNTGDMNISGILTVGQLNVPVEVSSFSPAIGATGVSVDTGIILTFNQTVGLGTTGFVQIKIGSATTGANNQTIYPVNTTLSNGGTVLNLNNSEFPDATNEIFPVMSSGFVVANGSDFAGINTVGSGVTYSFTTKPLLLGDSFGGGFLICQSGGTRWVVAPSSTEIVTTWFNRAAAVTNANANAACGDWFVPSCGQLQNPGYTCRTYWDCYKPSYGPYWSNSDTGGAHAWLVQFGRTCSIFGSKHYSAGVRAFRCVSY